MREDGKNAIVSRFSSIGWNYVARKMMVKHSYISFFSEFSCYYRFWIVCMLAKMSFNNQTISKYGIVW
jgi:hypothetical protein